MNPSGSQAFRTGDQGDGAYVNPILCADYSDPDVVCVGEDYYLTASSFNCMPGLPILHSHDLVNWSLIGHALDRFPDPSYDRPRHGAGVWAPSIRHHDGRFWIVFGTPDEGIFVTTAADPRGPWTPLHCMRPGRGLIDPCPFWDDDGRAYLIRAQAGSRSGGENSLLTLHRMAPDGSRLMDDGHVVIDGHHHHPIIEGPKLYKRNGWYYIFAPAGGVKGGWQAVFRARAIDGPYEDRIALFQGNTNINGPHQGGFVETPHGEHWFVHFQDRGAQGRVVHLQPMRWEDDWPLIGLETKARAVFEPILRHAMPRTNHPAPPRRPPDSDDFKSASLGLQWQWNANPQAHWHALLDGKLRLFAQGTPSGLCHWWEAGNLLLQKPQDMVFRATTKLRLRPRAAGDNAGLMLASGVSAALALVKDPAGMRLTLSGMSAPDQEAPRVVQALDWQADAVQCRLTMENGVAQFAWSADGETFKLIGDPLRPVGAAWLGAKVGLFCLNPGDQSSGGYADFDDFLYEVL